MARRRKWVNEIGTQTYYAWRSMRSRCVNPKNPSYHHYGGRGITVCARWVDDFDAFVEDVGIAPSGLTLECRDNNLGYSPENCCWATMEDQLNNQRRSVFVEHASERFTIAQWAKKLDIRFDTLWRRLRRMPPALALVSGLLHDVESPHATRSRYEAGCRCEECRAFHNKRMRDQRAKKKAKV